MGYAVKDFPHHLRSTLVVLSLSAMAACGGGGGGSGDEDDDPRPNFSIGGNISGNAGVVTLSLNGQQQSFPGSDFSFAQRIEQGQAWLVTFVSESTGLSCELANNSGAAQNNVNTVSITCAAASAPTLLRFDQFNIGGHLATGDFNGDGVPDLALSIQSREGNPLGANRVFTRYLHGEGGGLFTVAHDVEMIDQTYYATGITNSGPSAVVFDADDDGFDDYMLGPYLYRGSAGAAPSLSHTGTDIGRQPIHLADTDGDDRPDVIGIIYGASVLHYFGISLNNGDGTLALSQRFADRSDMGINGFVGPDNFVTADFDGDGHVDIALIRRVDPAVLTPQELVLHVLYGRGNGTFDLDAGMIDLPLDLKLNPDISFIFSKEIAARDVDSDGDIDLVITSDTSFLQVMINDGDGNFTVGQKVTVGNQPFRVRIADFNNDGVPDLASLNGISRTLHISFGKGDGTFGDESDGPGGYVSFPLGPLADAVDLAIADFDLDGALDIAISEYTTRTGDQRSMGSLRLFMAPGLD